MNLEHDRFLLRATHLAIITHMRSALLVLIMLTSCAVAEHIEGYPVYKFVDLGDIS